MKAKVVEIEDSLDALRQFKVVAEISYKYAGVDEVRLPLRLAAAKRRKEAERLYESDRRSHERDADAIPEGELTADEVRVVENRVEACRLVVRRILVARSEEEGGAETLVVLVHRGLDRGHVRADVRLSSGDGVARVRAEG